MKKLIFIIVLTIVCSAQAQTDEKENLKQINQSVISSYKNQKFDEALKFAQQAVDLSVKIYGVENRETAVAYANLAAIYQQKKKFKDSIENAQKAIDVYERIPNFRGNGLIEAYETLAYSQFLSDKKNESQTSYAKALEASERIFGKESKASFTPSLNLANIYARDGNFEKADEYYLKTYALAIKNFGKEAREIEQIEDSRACLFGGQKVDDDKEKIFKEAKNTLFGRVAGQQGIVNGKAISLPKPQYPAEAREKRLSGTASIKVTIDEQGNVIKTKSICRNDILGKAAEEAAKNAKFAPTLMDGKPVQVTGIIVYSFIAPR